MTQPEGAGKEDKVCRLLRSIYGLKQSSNSVLNNYLVQMGFTQASSDPCLYLCKVLDQIIIAIYVDDLVIAGKGMQSITNTKEHSFVFVIPTCSCLQDSG